MGRGNGLNGEGGGCMEWGGELKTFIFIFIFIS